MIKLETKLNESWKRPHKSWGLACILTTILIYCISLNKHRAFLECLWGCLFSDRCFCWHGIKIAFLIYNGYLVKILLDMLLAQFWKPHHWSIMTTKSSHKYLGNSFPAFFVLFAFCIVFLITIVLNLIFQIIAIFIPRPHITCWRDTVASL